MEVNPLLLVIWIIFPSAISSYVFYHYGYSKGIKKFKKILDDIEERLR